MYKGTYNSFSFGTAHHPAVTQGPPGDASAFYGASYRSPYKQEGSRKSVDRRHGQQRHHHDEFPRSAQGLPDWEVQPPIQVTRPLV